MIFLFRYAYGLYRNEYFEMNETKKNSKVYERREII